MKPFRTALVGLGQVVRNIHLPALAPLGERYRIDIAFDPDRAARERFAQAHPNVRVVESFERVLAAEPEVALIASPPAMHARQTIAALEAGCHVFCEKPMAESLEEADLMLAAMRRADRRLLINSEFPDMAAHQAARAEIGSSRFGRLLFVQMTQSFRTDDATEAGWRRDAQKRVCFEFGVHAFELACFYMGSTPSRLNCRMPDPMGAGKEVLNLISLEWPDGRSASIILNRLARGPHRYLDLTLTGERAEIACTLGGEARFEVGLRTNPTRPYASWAWAPGGRAVLREGDRSRVLATESFEPFADATRSRLMAFDRWIRDGDPPERGPDEHRKILALTLAAYEAAEGSGACELAL